MKNYLKKLVEDLEDYNLPTDLKAFDKIKCKLTTGAKVRWYYKEDLEFWEKWGDDNPVESGFNAGGGYYGIIIPKPDSYPRGELDPGDCVVVITSYPCEKCNPEVDWVALTKLIDDEDLVEIIK
jgi:hypothetical protein